LSAGAGRTTRTDLTRIARDSELKIQLRPVEIVAFRSLRSEAKQGNL
jgi:hypothetical protein